jgi:CheY-like chemotaxis protein
MTKSPTILCIDDMVVNLETLTVVLQRFGFNTIAVRDYSSALQAVTKQTVDLLIIDYHLADNRKGEEIAREVRIIRPDIPLIMFSGDPSLPDSAHQCVDAVLVKGRASPVVMLEVIKKLLPDTRLCCGSECV